MLAARHVDVDELDLVDEALLGKSDANAGRVRKPLEVVYLHHVMILFLGFVGSCCEACSARSKGQQMSVVRQRSTGAERHGDKDRFAELDLARAGTKRCFAMDVDSAWALCRELNSD